ncbi:hypothetical protein FACS1894137_03930 [Spirochaetia bacterium]|nr:hypothetical protein FACS1894137_03930 [Spirochaetia bacterium]
MKGIRFMKRFLVVFTLLCSISFRGFAASEGDLEIYTYLYNTASTPTEKLNILQVLQVQKLTGIGEFYAQAFNQLINQAATIRSYNATEQAAANDLAQNLAALIGDEKYTPSAPDLWRAYTEFSAPLVKAESLISLGKLRDPSYLDEVLSVIEKLNGVSPRGSDEVDANSYIARGAILALEKYRDESGYLPVFLMSVSGYPKRILDLAKATLPVILADPSELLTAQVIKNPRFDSSIKLVALQIIEDGDAPKASKAAAAAAALAEGWRGQAPSRTETAQLRKTSILMIGRHGPSDPAVYPLLERSYKEGNDDNEKVSSIQTLGVVATEDSAKQLSSFLMIIIGRIQSGAISRTDETMIREIIPAIATAGKPSGRAALEAAINGPTIPAIKVLAQAALDKLPR